MRWRIGSLRAGLILLSALFVFPVYGQNFINKLTHPDAVGGSFVATHLDGTFESSTSAGPGIEFFLKYNISPKAFFSAGLGAGTIYDGMLTSDNFKQTLLPTIDLKVGYAPLNGGSFSPFLFAGLQGFGWKITQGVGQTDETSYDASVFGGAGLEYAFNDKWAFHVTGDYRYIFTIDGDPKPKHWTAKAGFTYVMAPRTSSGPREEIEYPVGEGELALDDLFRDFDESSSDSGEEDALALLFQPEEESASTTMEENAASDMDFTQPTSYENAEVADLLIRIEELKAGMEQRRQQIESLQEQIRANERAIAEFTGRYYAGGSFGVGSDSEFKRNYEAALQKFYTKQYSEAIRLFSGLLASNPDHRLSSNCQYWIGETYNALGDYSKAIDAFNAVLRYKSSYKFDDALLMRGLCHLKLGDRITARENFQQLVSRFPESEYAPKAMRYLGRL